MRKALTNVPKAVALQRLQMRSASWGDVYTGKIEDLIAAGLVLPSQVPGLPGSARKLQASYMPDGQLCPEGSIEGYAFTIKLTGNGLASLRIPVSNEETERRCYERAHVNMARADGAFQQALRSMFLGGGSHHA